MTHHHQTVSLRTARRQAVAPQVVRMASLKVPQSQAQQLHLFRISSLARVKCQVGLAPVAWKRVPAIAFAI
jgi:hypothetical protein